MTREPILGVRAAIEFSYAQDDDVVYEIPRGLELRAGEAWCISGVSGSGKSTLMTLLASLRRFHRGALGYRFDGRGDVEVSPERWHDTVGPELWRHVGFAFQRPELIRALDVQGNLGLVLDGEAPGEILFEAAEWRRIRRSRVWRISGGQVQRLGLVRAFGAGQRLVFLDEPTNNLDRRNREAVADFVGAQRRDRALVVVSHDDDFIQRLGIEKVLTIDERTHDGRVRRILRPAASPEPPHRDQP